MVSRKQNHNQKSYFNYLLIVFIALLLGVQVYISNKIATSGKRLNELEHQAMVLEEDNRKLLAENVESLSLYNLYQKAEELGFVESEEVVNLNKGNAQLALR